MPFGWSMLQAFVPGVILGWAFVKWDFVVVFIAHLTFDAVLACSMLIRTPACVSEGLGALLAISLMLTACHVAICRWQNVET